MYEGSLENLNVSLAKQNFGRVRIFLNFRRKSDPLNSNALTPDILIQFHFKLEVKDKAVGLTRSQLP